MIILYKRKKGYGIKACVVFDEATYDFGYCGVNPLDRHKGSKRRARQIATDRYVKHQLNMENIRTERLEGGSKIFYVYVPANNGAGGHRHNIPWGCYKLLQKALKQANATRHDESETPVVDGETGRT